MRWGRVGYSGQNSWTVTGSDLDKAKAVFAKKFKVSSCREYLRRIYLPKIIIINSADSKAESTLGKKIKRI